MQRAEALKKVETIKAGAGASKRRHGQDNGRAHEGRATHK